MSAEIKASHLQAELTNARDALTDKGKVLEVTQEELQAKGEEMDTFKTEFQAERQMLQNQKATLETDLHSLATNCSMKDVLLANHTATWDSERRRLQDDALKVEEALHAHIEDLEVAQAKLVTDIET